MPRSLRTWLAAALIAVSSSACTATPPDLSSPPGQDRVEVPSPPAEVVIEGQSLRLELADGQTVEVATLPAGVDLLHATVRPGHDDPVTVLALTREDDRYELRYADITAGVATDLYWFPYRLQVIESVARIADVPTVPLWSPTGDAVAWLEWDRDGTRLRTVRWRDHEAGTNPSEDQAAYALEIPVGTQLEAWDVDDDGVEVLTATGGGGHWYIRLEADGPIAALARS